MIITLGQAIRLAPYWQWLRYRQALEWSHRPIMFESERHARLVPEPAPETHALGWPIAQGTISSRFGVPRPGHLHQGVDIAAREGEPVHVVASGRVTFAGWQRGYGRIIIVDHGQGLETCYAHLSAFLAQVGEQVDRGQVIGSVGHSGVRVSATHLHYEVRQQGRATNPIG